LPRGKLKLTYRRFVHLLAALASGVMLYFGSGLKPWWPLAWIAPIPLLVVARRATAYEAGWLAIAAGLLGAAGMANYYLYVAGPPLAVPAVAASAIVWGLVRVST
jgi:apolipoprotein N-acyltransferase